jgi:hypothetical protein
MKKGSPPPEIEKLLQRQAAWQKKQMDLSWVEKLRIAEAVLPDVKAIQKERKEQEKKKAR